MTEQQEPQKDFHELVYNKRTTLTQLAKKAGLNNIVMLSHWQQGDVLYPRYQSVVKVAEVLGVSRDELYEAIKESYKRAHSDPPDLAPAA